MFASKSRVLDSWSSRIPSGFESSEELMCFSIVLWRVQGCLSMLLEPVPPFWKQVAEKINHILLCFISRHFIKSSPGLLLPIDCEILGMLGRGLDNAIVQDNANPKPFKPKWLLIWSKKAFDLRHFIQWCCELVAENNVPVFSEERDPRQGRRLGPEDKDHQELELGMHTSALYHRPPRTAAWLKVLLLRNSKRHAMSSLHPQSLLHVRHSFLSLSDLVPGQAKDCRL